ncbi:MAG: DMT family transporter [Acidimicrobiales bacterium]
MRASGRRRPTEVVSPATAAALAAVTMWGLSPVATRAAVAQIAPIPMLVLRLPLAALFVLPWAIPVIPRLRRGDLPRVALCTLLGPLGYNLVATVSLQWIPASTAGLILGTGPLCVIAVGRVWWGESVSRRAWVGSGIALAGVAVLSGASAVGGWKALAGVALLLTGNLSFGAYTYVVRPLSGAYGALPVTAVSTALAAMPALALAGTVTGPVLRRVTPAGWAEVAFLAVGCTVGGLLLWNLAVLHGGGARAALVLYLEPAVTVAGAAVFLGEGLAPSAVAGGLLVLVGVVLAVSTWLPARLRRRWAVLRR